MQKALLLIDIQNDYFPAGKCELVDTQQAAQNAQKVLQEYRKKRLPVIHVQHVNTREGATFFLPNTQGVEINELVKPLENEKVVVKHFPNSFLQTNLDEVLKENDIKELVICGMMSHMCIDTTVRACQGKGLNVTLLSDACTTKDLVFQDETIPAKTVHNAFMAALNNMFAQVVTTEQFLKSV